MYSDYFCSFTYFILFDLPNLLLSDAAMFTDATPPSLEVVAHQQQLHSQRCFLFGFFAQRRRSRTQLQTVGRGVLFMSFMHRS